MKKMTVPRPALLAALVAATCCSSAYAGKTVSWEDILNDDKTTGDVLALMQSMGFAARTRSFRSSSRTPRRQCSSASSPSSRAS